MERVGGERFPFSAVRAQLSESLADGDAQVAVQIKGVFPDEVGLVAVGGNAVDSLACEGGEA